MGIKDTHIKGDIISSDNEKLIPNNINISIPFSQCVVMECKTPTVSTNIINATVAGVTSMGIPSMIELIGSNGKVDEFWITFREPEFAIIEDVNDPSKQQTVKVHLDDITYFLSGSKLNQPIRLIYERTIHSYGS